MLAEALAEIERSNLLQADRQLARIEILAPDFLPAYIERARLLERRGYIQKAAEQWSEVLKRSMGTPLYEQAAAERIRLARLEAAEARLPSRPASETRPAGRIRISSVDMEKFQQNDQFDEMRLLRITLKSREKNLDPADMRIEVTFFDELKDTREVIPTRAVAPGDPLRPDGETRGKQPHYVTAAYLVPKGFRAEEETNFGSSGKYHGYLVRLLYQGQLQDERARPKALLKRVEELQPIHMAP
jgi:multidrug efflux pump subunit AcrA (membrane-fusion protein)